MAMDKDVLGAQIAAILTSPSAPPDKAAGIKQMWTDIAGAIIDHITSFAEVNAGITVSVTTSTGPAVGATTGTGTIK